MCFICSESKGFETNLATIIEINQTPTLEVSKNTFSTPTKPVITDSNGNKYTFNIVGLDQTSSLYSGIYLNSVKGIEYISSKFKWKGTIDFVVKYEENPPSNWDATDPKNNWTDRGFGGYGNTDEALYEITTGIDRYTGVTGWDDTLYNLDYDIGSFIFPSPYSSTKLYNYTYEVFIDENPIAELDSAVPSNTHDYFSLFLHETGHGMGVHPDNTTFTNLIQEINGTDYFTGEAAVSINNGYIEVVDNKTHFLYEENNGEIYDLMGSTKGYRLYEQNRFTITKLDQAIYGDLGFGILLDGDNTNENYIGGLGDDIINTFGGNDVIKGRSGDDIINGGDGSDKFILSGPKSYYTVSKIDDNKYKIIDNISNDGTDEVTSIETLEFSDQILILDPAPTDIQLSKSSFNENISDNSIIANLSSSDSTSNDNHTYSLASGSGDTDNSLFSINGTSLKIKTSPDYETKSSYAIRIQSTDSHGNNYSEAFTLLVNDIEVEFIATISGTSRNDNLESTSSNDSIDGGQGIDTIAFTGNFSSYSFTRGTDTLEIADQRTTGTTDGTDTLKNIEYIQFSDQTVEESKVDVVKTYSGEFSDYKFYNKGNGVYQIKTDSGYDDITGLPLLTFTGEATTSSFKDISAIVDIKGTFDLVTGLNTDSGRMFRLYNASFKRLPDPDGLEYWINQFSSGANTIRVVASSFLGSGEFAERYGSNVTDETFVNTLYKNVLGRDADPDGLNYWLGQLNSGAETRYEALLGFAESAENKALFTDMTGFG